MRKFLKQMRKGLRTACVTAALATCWNVGQSIAHAGYSGGDEVTVHLSGTISPTEKDLSHVYLIYGSGFSSSLKSGLNAVALGDFSAGDVSSFSVYGDAVYNEAIFWFIAGLYGDLSSGQYVDSVNGVTLSMLHYYSYMDWGYFVDTPEATMFDYLMNDSVSNVSVYGDSPVFGRVYFTSDFDQCDMYDFSDPSLNGEATITCEIVPEPVTLLLFSAGGFWILRQRPKED